MQCANPISIQNKLTQKTMLVPCGKCLQCRINKTAEWTMRIMAELNSSTNNYFITLTYDNAHLPYNMNLTPQDLTKFFKRFRKKKLAAESFKYFACGEYGDEGQRPHYHAIMLNTKLDINKFYTWTDARGKKMLSSAEIDEVWKMGNTTISGVGKESIQYVTGYVRKKLSGEKGKEIYGSNNPPFSRISKGIGKSWVEQNAELILEQGKIIYGEGIAKQIPRTWYKWLEKFDEKKTSETKIRAKQEALNNELEKAKDAMKYWNENFEGEKIKYIEAMGQLHKQKHAELKEIENQSLEKTIKGNL